MVYPVLWGRSTTKTRRAQRNHKGSSSTEGRRFMERMFPIRDRRKFAVAVAADCTYLVLPLRGLQQDDVPPWWTLCALGAFVLNPVRLAGRFTTKSQRTQRSHHDASSTERRRFMERMFPIRDCRKFPVAVAADCTYLVLPLRVVPGRCPGLQRKTGQGREVEGEPVPLLR